MDITLKIRELIDAENMTISSFEKKIGASNNTIRVLLDRNSNVSGAILNKILIAFPNVSAEWLLRGNGTMYLNSTKNYTINEDENLAVNEPVVKYIKGIDKAIYKTITEIEGYMKELQNSNLSKQNLEIKNRLIELLYQKLEILNSTKKEIFS